MLELRIAGRDFGQPVLGEIVATVARGDRICLLGPSGIGKTTLLNAIGYLFQEHRLLPWRSLHANLRLVGAGDQEAENLLGQVGLTGYGHYLPDQLSLGMARRAALARCLAVKPDLLLLDEPFASLDPVMVSGLKALIADILDANPGMAMICVTHDGADAEVLANRLWYLDGKPARLQWDDAIGEPGQLQERLGQLRTPELTA